jgi:hypothetical protein
MPFRARHKPTPRTDEERQFRRERDQRAREALKNDVHSHLIDALVDARPSLQELPKLKLRNIAYLVSLAFRPARRHKARHDAFSIGHREIRAALCRTSFAQFNAKHQIFDVEDVKKAGHTRAYRLKPDIKAGIVKKMLAATASAERGEFILPTGHKRRTRPNPVRRTGLHRNSPWRSVSVPQLVPMNPKALDRLQNDLLDIQRLEVSEQSSALKELGHEGKQDASDLLQAILMIRAHANSPLAERGCLIHEYVQNQSGRLFAAGVNLQSAPKIVKRAALHGRIEYDFANAHIAMLYQLARQHGCKLPTVARYLRNKKMWRRRLAERLDLPLGDVKVGLIQIGYGARRCAHRGALRDKLGAAGARAFINDPFVRKLSTELRTASAKVISIAPRRDGKVINAMGFTFDAGSRRDSSARQLAHLLQGFEALMLHAVVEMHPNELLLLEHDGWVSSVELDVAAIEAKVLERTGLRMQIEQRKIAYENVANTAKPLAITKNAVIHVKSRPAVRHIASVSPSLPSALLRLGVWVEVEPDVALLFMRKALSQATTGA